MDSTYAINLLLLIFGFGFVIFWHELGHFLAAKWAGVRVEQFAVGFGQALLSWRKGIGVRVGSTRTEYERRANEYLRSVEHDPPEKLAAIRGEETRLNFAADHLGLGQTEYRLNWIPLGGYVKMLGQDDLDPTAQSPDPSAYNNKPVGQRMVIVSAGVLMNILLAAILFAVLFRVGFNVPPAVVGSLQPGSPAQLAGLQVGDTILTLDGTRQHDFNKILLNAALVDPGEPARITVRRVDGTEEELRITPKLSDRIPGLRSLGFDPPRELRGVDPKRAELPSDEMRQLMLPDALAVLPGETVLAVNGDAVDPVDYAAFDRLVQQSRGAPLVLTVQTVGGETVQRSVEPSFIEPFGDTELNFAGMVPRARVVAIEPGSPTVGQLQPGDVIAGIRQGETLVAYSPTRFRSEVAAAGENETPLKMVVWRQLGGVETMVELEGIVPTFSVGQGRRGLGVQLAYDDEHAVVAGVLSDSAAARAQLPAGAMLVRVGTTPVTSWHDVQQALREIAADQPFEVVASIDGHEQAYTLRLTEPEAAALRANRYAVPLAFLKNHVEPRRTDSTAQAAWWGVTETRDMIIQFYLTLRRMIDGSVSAKNLSGPVGIVHTGSILAWRGGDWLLWFLAMISANLAVVNFLPIPIVDGGLFAFLLLEKLTGKPPSQRAQSVAQLIGLTLIIGLFLFVTYNDIMRLL